jgi:hypothetical protein
MDSPRSSKNSVFVGMKKYFSRRFFRNHFYGSKHQEHQKNVLNHLYRVANNRAEI